MVGKRGYFFVIDAIVAATVLLFGLFILFGSSVRTQQDLQPFVSVEDFTSILQNRPLSQGTNTYYVTTLLPGGFVPYADSTPFEEISYLVFYDPVTCPTCITHASELAESLADDYVEDRYGIAIYVNDTLVYERTKPKSDILLNRSVIIYTRMNSTVLVGPLRGDVLLWN